MQMNPKEQINNLSEIYSTNIEDIILTSELGRNIGLINSFYPKKQVHQSEEIVAIYNRLRKIIEEKVLNYQYRLILLHKITFLFNYGKIDCLKDSDKQVEIIGSIIKDEKESLIYTLGINITDEKIVITSMDEIENESISNIIEITYKTITQDDISQYIKDISIKTKYYVDVDSPYEEKNITKKLLCLKEDNDNIITVLKRKNNKDTTTLLCHNYQGFKEDRVIREYKKYVTEWNGVGENIGYVIGSYADSTIEYGKKINGEEYFYASRNTCPTFCDITSDFIKVPLSFQEFDAAKEGITLKEATPISDKIDAAENEYTFGYLKKIESTKPFV